MTNSSPEALALGVPSCKPTEGTGPGGRACSANEHLFEAARRDRQKTAILERLAYGKVVAVEHHSMAGSVVYTVTLEYKRKFSKAIFKLHRDRFDGPHEDRELAAAAFSEVIGFRVVPGSLLRTITINGKERTGFIQEFVEGRTLHEVKNPIQLLRSSAHGTRYNLIKTLDLLLNNSDRSFSNLLLGRDRKLYAIDHAGSTFNPGWHPIPHFVSDGELPLKEAQDIVRFASDPRKFDDLLASFSFISDGAKENSLRNGLRAIADSIEFRDGKAFISRDKLAYSGAFTVI